MFLNIPSWDKFLADAINNPTGYLLGEYLLSSVHSSKYGRFLKLMIGARLKAGFTQQQLARKLNKPQSYISKYESGERRLDLIEFLEIANHLKIDQCQFIKEISRRSGKSKSD